MPRRLTNEEFLQKLKDNNIINYIPLEEYKGVRKKIKWHCNIHDIDFYKTPYDIYNGKGCKKCRYEKMSNTRRKSTEDFTNELKEIQPNIIVKGEYKGRKEKIECICENGHHFMGEPGHLLEGVGCPYCASKSILPEKNSFWALHPEFHKFFADNEDINLAKSVAGNCVTTKLKLTCPDCGNIEYKTPNLISQRGHRCEICSDKNSYPNRILRQILLALKELGKEIKELKFEYAVNINNTYYKYDASFYYNYIHFCVEFDGGFHDRQIMGSNLKYQKERDRLKDEYARDNDIHLIRVKALGWLSKDVKQSYLKSELNDIFDLDSLDWVEVDKKSQQNKIKQICDIISINSGKFTFPELNKLININIPALWHYYEKGVKFGWCKDNDIIINSRKSNLLSKLYDSNGNLLGVFRNKAEMARYLNINTESNYIYFLDKKIKELGYEIKRITKEEYYDYLKSILILPEDNKEGE